VGAGDHALRGARRCLLTQLAAPLVAGNARLFLAADALPAEAMEAASRIATVCTKAAAPAAALGWLEFQLFAEQAAQHTQRMQHASAQTQQQQQRQRTQGVAAAPRPLGDAAAAAERRRQQLRARASASLEWAAARAAAQGKTGRGDSLCGGAPAAEDGAPEVEHSAPLAAARRPPGRGQQQRQQQPEEMEVSAAGWSGAVTPSSYSELYAAARTLPEAPSPGRCFSSPPAQGSRDFRSLYARALAPAASPLPAISPGEYRSSASAALEDAALHVAAQNGGTAEVAGSGGAAGAWGAAAWTAPRGAEAHSPDGEWQVGAGAGYGYGSSALSGAPPSASAAVPPVIDLFSSQYLAALPRPSLPRTPAPDASSQGAGQSLTPEAHLQQQIPQQLQKQQLQEQQLQEQQSQAAAAAASSHREAAARAALEAELQQERRLNAVLLRQLQDAQRCAREASQAALDATPAAGALEAPGAAERSAQPGGPLAALQRERQRGARLAAEAQRGAEARLELEVALLSAQREAAAARAAAAAWERGSPLARVFAQAKEELRAAQDEAARLRREAAALARAQADGEVAALVAGATPRLPADAEAVVVGMHRRLQAAQTRARRAEDAVPPLREALQAAQRQARGAEVHRRAAEGALQRGEELRAALARAQAQLEQQCLAAAEAAGAAEELQRCAAAREAAAAAAGAECQRLRDVVDSLRGQVQLLRAGAGRERALRCMPNATPV
jgi:hypothetical protein